MSATTLIISFIAGIAFILGVSAVGRKSIRVKHSGADERDLLLAMSSAKSMGRSIIVGQVIMALAMAFILFPKYRDNDLMLGIILFCFIASNGARTFVRDTINSASAELELRRIRREEIEHVPPGGRGEAPRP